VTTRKQKQGNRERKKETGRNRGEKQEKVKKKVAPGLT
jgi:hypothetical protein